MITKHRRIILTYKDNTIQIYLSDIFAHLKDKNKIHWIFTNLLLQCLSSLIALENIRNNITKITLFERLFSMFLVFFSTREWICRVIIIFRSNILINVISVYWRNQRAGLINHHINIIKCQIWHIFKYALI